MSMWSRMKNVLRGERVSREIDEEFEAHIAETVDDGRDPAEARRAFGSMPRLREQSRHVRFVAWYEWLRADAVFGWRQLSRRKVTSAAAILSLALTIGSLHLGLLPDRRQVPSPPSHRSSRTSLCAIAPRHWP